MAKDPYKRIASLYDGAVEPFNKGIRKYAFKVADVQPGIDVLEVGCGTGANLELFLEHGCNISGIDLSPAMLKIAADKLGQRAKLVTSDAADMQEFSDSSFDLVIAMLTLHEMPQSIRVKVLREMRRVMKKEGRILLVDYHTGPLRMPMGLIYKGIILFFEVAAGREHYKNYRNFIKNGTLPPLIKQTGLLVDKKKIISKGNFAIYLLKK